MTAGHDPGKGTQSIPSQGPPQAGKPEPWREFGQQVLAAHHRNGLGAQCICGSLTYHCPVITVAERLGLPTDDPRGRQ